MSAFHYQHMIFTDLENRRIVNLLNGNSLALVL